MVGMSPKPAGKSPEMHEAVMMTAQAEARHLVELIAGPLRLGENVKGALSRVARVTGLNDRRVRGIWHLEARSIRSEEMDRLRRVALDAKTREEVDVAYRTHLSRLRAYREALRISSPHEAGGLDHDRLRLAGAENRPLDRGTP